MIRMLASVTDVEEALLALEGGADIIDLKNPAAGALGALPFSTIDEIVAAVAGRSPVSATIGDLPMKPVLLAEAVARMAATGVDIVKIGFFGNEAHAACIDAMQPLARIGIKIVAVLFADADPDLNLLPKMAQAGFHGVMLDTATKNGKRLPALLDPGAMRSFVQEARDLGLLTGLAGSLAISDVAPLCECRPDYLGFRGALCESSNRQARLNRSRLDQLKDVLYSCNTALKVPA